MQRHKGHSQNPGLLSNLLGAATSGAGSTNTPDASDDSNGGMNALSATPNISAPGFWSRLFNPNLASGYQQGQFGLAQQQLANQGGLQRTQQEGQNTLANTTKQGANQIAAQNNAQVADWATKNGLDMSNPDDILKAHQALFPSALANAQRGQTTQSLKTGLENNALVNPMAQPNADAGVNGSLFRQAAENMSLTRNNLNMGEIGSQVPYLGAGVISQGNLPVGSSNTSSTGFNPQTGMKTTTDTSIPSYRQGGVNFNFDGMGVKQKQIPLIKSPANSGLSDGSDTNPYGDDTTINGDDNTPQPLASSNGSVGSQFSAGIQALMGLLQGQGQQQSNATKPIVNSYQMQGGAW